MDAAGNRAIHRQRTQEFAARRKTNRTQLMAKLNGKPARKDKEIQKSSGVSAVAESACACPISAPDEEASGSRPGAVRLREALSNCFDSEIGVAACEGQGLPSLPGPRGKLAACPTDVARQTTRGVSHAKKTFNI